MAVCQAPICKKALSVNIMMPLSVNKEGRGGMGCGKGNWKEGVGKGERWRWCRG